MTRYISILSQAEAQRYLAPSGDRVLHAVQTWAVLYSLGDFVNGHGQPCRG